MPTSSHSYGIALLVVLLMSVSHVCMHFSALAQNCNGMGDLDLEQSGLSWDFYEKTCPILQSLVRQIVDTYLDANITNAAGLLRLHFHDCFVQGCDGSVLLVGDGSEQTAIPNLSLRPEALSILNDIKAQVEQLCPNTVSCADIVALAARDSVAKALGPNYCVLLGRRDSLTFANTSVVLSSLPSPFENVSQLLSAFEVVGLDAVDLVALSGGHSIGRAHCSSFASRLTSGDSILDADFESQLESICPTASSTNFTILDVITPNTFDNKYYHAVATQRGLLASDSALNFDSRTNGTVALFASNQSCFFRQFAVSMNKMGSFGVLTGSQGEIRTSCSTPNPSSVASTVQVSTS